MSMQGNQYKLYEYLSSITGNKNNKNCLRRLRKKNITKQVENKFAEYSILENYLRRISSRNNDRVIPITNETLNEFNLKTGSNVEKAVAYYGANSDEMARAYHANAITIGNAIFFRNGAYKPETEEGRKTLAHELTHVQQNKEDILEGQRPIEELEKEAEKTEIIEEYNPDPKIKKVINGKEYYLTSKQLKSINEDIVRDIGTWVDSQEYQMTEEDFFKLLLKYEEFENTYEKIGELNWN